MHFFVLLLSNLAIITIARKLPKRAPSRPIGGGDPLPKSLSEYTTKQSTEMWVLPFISGLVFEAVLFNRITDKHVGREESNSSKDE